MIPFRDENILLSEIPKEPMWFHIEECMVVVSVLKIPSRSIWDRSGLYTTLHSDIRKIRLMSETLESALGSMRLNASAWFIHSFMFIQASAFIMVFVPFQVFILGIVM